MADVSVEERQFSLMLALIGAKNGVTKQELFDRVAGYMGREVTSALERQFERDKDDLRSLGVEIDVFTPFMEQGNNQESRYRLLDSVLGTPEEFEFSSEERVLIDLALQVWREGGLSEESKLAAMKLRSDPQFRTGLTASVAPAQSARDIAFHAVKSATDKGRLLKFDYVKPGEAAPTRRRVEPWCVLLFRNRWMLHGRDLDHDAPRTFLIRRIVGQVTSSAPKSPFVIPERAAEVALGELEAIWATSTAKVRVLPGSDAERRLVWRRDTEVDGDVLTLHHADANLLADELAGYGADVVVLEPERLRHLVIDRLTRIRDLHGGRE